MGAFLSTTYKLHWSLVLNTQDKNKASRVLRPLEPYENLVVEKFKDPSCSGIKAYLDVPLAVYEWPGIVAAALQKATWVGIPSIVYISSEGAYNSLEGTIVTPSMVGVEWAGWSLVWE
jgi:hypothetical protein